MTHSLDPDGFLTPVNTTRARALFRIFLRERLLREAPEHAERHTYGPTSNSSHHSRARGCHFPDRADRHRS